MRILGIDPGLQTTGFGVIDVQGAALSYVASGTIRTTKLDLGDLPGRLKVLFDGIREVEARYQPEMASVEIVFVNVNPQSTLLLGQARGACITALVSAMTPLHASAQSPHGTQLLPTPIFGRASAALPALWSRESAIATPQARAPLRTTCLAAHLSVPPRCPQPKRTADARETKGQIRR